MPTDAQGLIAENQRKHPFLFRGTGILFESVHSSYSYLQF